MDEMNPKIRTVKIGIRTLTEIKIYPLSIAGQGDMADLISSACKEFFVGQEKTKPTKTKKTETILPAQMSDLDFIKFVIDLLKKNLQKMLCMTTDFSDPKDADGLLANMDNDQAVEIAEIIFEQNYENSIKNSLGLFNRFRELFKDQMKSDDNLKGPSPQSSNDIHDTGLNTSSGSVLRTED